MFKAFKCHTGRECLRRTLFGPGNHNDHKRPKFAQTDSSTFSENTPIREGKNLLSRMCTLDAVMTWKPLFYGETNDIVVFGKMLNFFVA